MDSAPIDVDLEEEWEGPSPSEVSASKPTSTRKRKATEGVADDPIIIVNYSEKSLGIFGGTMAIKDKLKELGGRFNKFLTHDGIKKPGWIVTKGQRADLIKWLNAMKIPVVEVEDGPTKKANVSEGPSDPAASAAESEQNPSHSESGRTPSTTGSPGWVMPKNKRAELDEELKARNVVIREAPVAVETVARSDETKASAETIISTPLPIAPAPTTSIYIVDYNDRCIAVFGDTISIKSCLKEAGAKFNPHLTYNNAKKLCILL
ncbi:hypothetical protein HDU67_004320 [Dinochytrium kinnereticum]|nr:hypothetical protein HDU67_004320 [Dinochytrium kinnereticum]